MRQTNFSASLMVFVVFALVPFTFCCDDGTTPIPTKASPPIPTKASPGAFLLTANCSPENKCGINHFSYQAQFCGGEPAFWHEDDDVLLNYTLTEDMAQYFEGAKAGDTFAAVEIYVPFEDSSTCMCVELEVQPFGKVKFEPKKLQKDVCFYGETVEFPFTFLCQVDSGGETPIDGSVGFRENQTPILRIDSYEKIYQDYANDVCCETPWLVTARVTDFDSSLSEVDVFVKEVKDKYGAALPKDKVKVSFLRVVGQEAQFAVEVQPSIAPEWSSKVEVVLVAVDSSGGQSWPTKLEFFSSCSSLSSNKSAAYLCE